MLFVLTLGPLTRFDLPNAKVGIYRLFLYSLIKMSLELLRRNKSHFPRFNSQTLFDDIV